MMPLPHPGKPLRQASRENPFSSIILTHHQPVCTQVFSPFLQAGFALLLSYLPVSLPVFLWPTLSETFWGLTFQAPHWAFLIFVYLFSAVSPPLLGCLLACLLDFLILPVSHPFFSVWVYQPCWELAASLLALTLACLLASTQLKPCLCCCFGPEFPGGKAERRKNDA